MSYRNIFFKSKGVSRDLNHKWRKFQVPKSPTLVITKPKTKTIEVEVPIDDNQD